MTGEISRKEYEETIRVPLLETARKHRWWTPSGIASSPLMNRKIVVLALMADLPMKIRPVSYTHLFCDFCQRSRNGLGRSGGRESAQPNMV